MGGIYACTNGATCRSDGICSCQSGYTGAQCQSC